MCHTLLINREGQRESSLYSHCQSLKQNLCSATEAVPVLGPHVSLQQPGEAEVCYALLPLSFFAPEKKKCFFLFFFPGSEHIGCTFVYLHTQTHIHTLGGSLYGLIDYSPMTYPEIP